MKDSKIELLMKEFWKSDFNKALIVCTMLFTIISIFIRWIVPVIMILWIIFLFRFDIRDNYPNHWYLLIFLILAIIFYQFDPNFSSAIVILIGCLFVPEDKWEFLVRKKK